MTTDESTSQYLLVAQDVGKFEIKVGSTEGPESTQLGLSDTAASAPSWTAEFKDTKISAGAKVTIEDFNGTASLGIIKLNTAHGSASMEVQANLELEHPCCLGGEVQEGPIFTPPSVALHCQHMMQVAEPINCTRLDLYDIST
jgi:hypothetical protein